MLKKSKTAAEKLYARYEYLAENYANKLFNTNSIGMDREDIVQELKLKIFLSIKAYGKRWAEFKRTQLFKPVPLKYYLQSALNKKLIDMTDKIQKSVHKYPISIEDCSFDFGVSSTNSIVNLSGKNKEAVVGGVDLLQGLDLKQKEVFCMFLKGHPIKTIEKVYKAQVKDISKVISNQVTILREHKDELYGQIQKVHYTYELSEED